jgi:hypothetical protein
VVIIGLLLIALLCLVLGLITQGAVWLIASLIATGGAAYLLYKLRDVIVAPKGTSTRGFLLPELPDQVGKAALVPRTAGVDASPPDALDKPDLDAPRVDGAQPEPAAVPDVHSAARPASGQTAATASGGANDEVWVIDGRPRYHLGDCAIIKGQDAEPIPYEQATEDGFMPCSLCEPPTRSLIRRSDP